MKTSLSIGGALLALAAFASTANAGMTGGINMPTSLSRGDTRIPMTSSIGSVRTFSPDGHVGSHWKKPIDSDQGGPDDPPKKTPKDPTQANGGGTSTPTGGYYPPRPHPHYGQGGSTQPPLACRGRPGGC